MAEREAHKDILYLNFNQISTSLCVGSKTGYTLYELDQVHECKPVFESMDNVDDICIIERNFKTSLVAYVKLDSPRNLVLYHCSKGFTILERLFPNTIISVKLNRLNVVVCLEDRIYILYIKALSEGNTHIITNTVMNAKGLIALDHGTETSLLAYPGSAVTGDVQIFDMKDRCAKTTIPAHESQLAAIVFNDDGDKLATASIKGTVIRVFSVTSGEVLFNFRRGVKRCVEIQYLDFSRDGQFLCMSSNTETIHVFKLCREEKSEPTEEVEGWMEMFGRVLTTSASYLPANVSDVLTQQRAFAYVHLPFTDHKTVCTITLIKNVTYVIVASLEGYLYMYELNTEIGGPCHLVRQHRLEGPRKLPPSSRNYKQVPPKILTQLSQDSTTDEKNSAEVPEDTTPQS